MYKSGHQESNGGNMKDKEDFDDDYWEDDEEIVIDTDKEDE